MLYVDGHEVLAAAHAMVDGTTNNQAEYLGAALAVHLVAAGVAAARRGGLPGVPLPTSVSIIGDSKLVVQQVRGKWQVRAKRLVACVAQVRAAARDLRRALDAHGDARGDGTPDPAARCGLMAHMPGACPIPLEWAHVRRALNKRADALSNDGMDAHTGRWSDAFCTAPSPFPRRSALGAVARGPLGIVKASPWKVLEQQQQ